MKSTGAGQYNKRVTIERLKASATVDASGHIDETGEANWETYCSRWAKVTYGRGGEMMSGTQQIAKRNPLIHLMYDTATKEITTAMRLVMDDRIFSVAEPPVVMNEDRRVVQFAAVEVVT